MMCTSLLGVCINSETQIFACYQSFKAHSRAQPPAFQLGFGGPWGPVLSSADLRAFYFAPDLSKVSLTAVCS